MAPLPKVKTSYLPTLCSRIIFPGPEWTILSIELRLTLADPSLTLQKLVNCHFHWILTVEGCSTYTSDRKWAGRKFRSKRHLTPFTPPLALDDFFNMEVPIRVAELHNFLDATARLRGNKLVLASSKKVPAASGFHSGSSENDSAPSLN